MITIDGRQVLCNETDKNIIEAAKRAGIYIPAPCYHSSRKNGCCKVCAVLVEGKLRYACSTKPYDGMNIITDDKKLQFIRKMRMKSYINRINKNNKGRNISA